MPITDPEYKIDIKGSLAFLIVHLGCLLAFWSGVSWIAVIVMLITYLVRAFGLTAGYHRYFSHRSFKTNRIFQFVLAFIGTSAAQMGPLWWAGHHRDHHKKADTEEDIHSPVISGFWWSQIGWILSSKYVPTKMENMTDFDPYPEIRFINKYHYIAPISLAFGLFLLGAYLHLNYPQFNTSPFQLIVWGFFISTVLLYHATFFTNSITHMFGKRRFATKDNSRNNLWVAIITLGEGWHNNHHRFPASEPQGFYWWEIDVTHYTLKLFSLFGLVRDIKTPPKSIYEEAELLKKQGVAV